MVTPVPLRCAVYTRKSTEEGLDQEFNSIDAQREACLAYISSQKSQGWVALENNYDDGGFSGGNMERPAIQQLMKDMSGRKIDIIVVYKIDRLTRSLWDFVKLADLFEKHSVTFVSITQSFNTTTSMGRLTMNILLSFAQFEREVTAERIRDKVAASKKKGIWMGGTTPTGYDVKNRQLIPNAEASFIKMVYERCVELGAIAHVVYDFKNRGIKSPVRTLVNGTQVGGYTFTNGAMRHILTNPVYIGKIKHKTALYDGFHQPTLPIELWQKVQEIVANRSLQVRREKNYAADPAIFQGKLFDTRGKRYIVTYVSKKNRKYKYYLTEKPDKGARKDTYRLSADEIENHAHKTMQEHMGDPSTLGKILMLDRENNLSTLQYIAVNSYKLTHTGCAIGKVILSLDQYTLEIRILKLYQHIEEILKIKMPEILEDAVFKLAVPFLPARATRGTDVINPPCTEGDIEIFFDLPKKDVKNLVYGIAWREEHFKEKKSLGRIAEQYGVSRGLVEKLILESFDKMLRPYFSFK